MISMQVYRIRLIDGSVVEISEEYDKQEGLIDTVNETIDNEMICVGDPLMGFVYIPKRSIVLIETAGICEADSETIEILRGGGC